jgi:uncharacterized membrane protein YebE (DUF533 family)
MSLVAVDAKVFEEVVFISVLGEDLKDADHLVVTVRDQLVEERNS